MKRRKRVRFDLNDEIIEPIPYEHINSVEEEEEEEEGRIEYLKSFHSKKLK